MFDKIKEWELFVDSKVGKTFDIKLASLYNVLLNICLEYNSTLIITTDKFLSEQSFISLKVIKKHLTRLFDTEVVSLTEKNLGSGVYELRVKLPSELK